MENLNERIDKMLDIPEANGENVDDGSFYYDVASMYAIEEEDTIATAEEIGIQRFVQDAPDEVLKTEGAQIGYPINASTYASGDVKFTGPQGTIIPENTTVTRSIDGATYHTTIAGTIPSSLDLYLNVECDIIGSVGNAGIETINTVGIAGVTVTNDTIIMNATDEESVEDYRKRLEEVLKAPRRSGNKHHVVEWANEFLGIGQSRCIPVWNGAGTLKVLAVDDVFDPISESKRQELHQYILGKLTDFSELTTSIPTERVINFEITGILATNYTASEAIESITNALNYFFDTLSLVGDETTVEYFEVACVITGTGCLSKMKTLTLNGGTVDIELLNTEIPKVGIVTVTEVS